MTAIAGLDAKTDLAGVVAGGAIPEDVMRKLYDISKDMDLPFLDMAGTGTVSAPSFDWVRQRLTAPADNAFVETAEFATSGSVGVTAIVDTSHVPLNRYRNHINISAKMAAVSDMSQLGDSFGGAMAEQVMMAQKELYQDIEYMITCRNQASVAGNGASTAPRSASLMAYPDVNWNSVSTNDLFLSLASASASTPGGWDGTSVFDAATIGTPTTTALAESDLRDMVQIMYTMGATSPGKAITLLTGAAIKRVISEYYYTSTAKAAPLLKTSGSGPDQEAVGSVEYIVTDFATLKLVPSPWMSTLGTGSYYLFLLDPKWWEVVYLQGVTASAAAKRGLVVQRPVTAYWATRGHPETIATIVDIANSAMTAT